MPTFSVECQFEVYCNTCGNGLCNNSHETTTRNRNANALRVDVCDRCIDAKNDEIAELEEEIKRLEKELEKCQN